MMRCCVIDDEPLAAELIAGYIRKIPFMELAGVFNSAQEAVRPVMAGEIDLVFLDINMPQLNGLEFARLLPAHTQVIFTTAYDSHAVEAFRIGAIDYLLKPISFEEFTATASRAYARHPTVSTPAATTPCPAADGYILVRNNHRLEQLPASSILYAEGLKDYVKINLDSGVRVVTHTSLRTLESHLPNGRFLRVHRSFIVNTAAIRHIERTRLTLTDGTHIPVSDGSRQTITDYIASHTAD